MNLNHKKTLQRAYDIATKQGWVKPGWYPRLFNASREQSEQLAIACMLADIGFAQALWGDANVGKWNQGSGGGFVERTPDWELHLREWVIAKNKMAYLATHLPQENA